MGPATGRRPPGDSFPSSPVPCLQYLTLAPDNQKALGQLRELPLQRGAPLPLARDNRQQLLPAGLLQSWRLVRALSLSPLALPCISQLVRSILNSYVLCQKVRST